MVPIVTSTWLLILACLFQGACVNLVSSSCLKHERYTVSSSGSDTPKCITGNSTASCQHLEYLFLKVQTCATVTILSDLTLTTAVRPSPLTDVIIAGSTASPITISCANSSSGQGLIFASSQRLTLQGLRFVSCSVQCLHNNAGIYPFMDYAAVCIHQGSDVNITSCIFQNSAGTGVIMHDVVGSNQLVDTNFTMNGHNPKADSTAGALIVRRQSVPGMAVFSLKNCNFSENKNLDTFLHSSLNSAGLGGALHLHTGVQNSTTHLFLERSHFSSNKASRQGGGVHVNQSGDNSVLIIEVSSSHFQSNRATNGGGGMWYFQTSHCLCSCQLNFSNSSFHNNTGSWGGGVGVYSISSSGNLTIQANNSTWSENSANLGASAVGVAGWAEPNAIPNSKTFFRTTGEFKNCSILRNHGRSNISKESVGSIQIHAARARFRDCYFHSNTRTALYVFIFSYVAFAGNTTFSGNRGIRGGAAYVDSKSLIGLEEGVTLQFDNNHAIIEAGAIYTETLDPSFHVPQDTCVFESLGLLLKSKRMYKVHFSNNTANGKNQTIFVGSSHKCVDTNDSILLFNSKIFTFEPPGNGQVLSFASNLTDLGHTPNSGNCLEVMLGQYFHLIPKVTDVFGNAAYLTGTLILVEHVDSETTRDVYDLELVGPSIISMDNYTQQHELYIRGDEKYTGNEHQLFMLFIYKFPWMYHNEHKEWRLKLVECKTGFRYDNQSRMCNRIVDNNLVGNTNLSLACIRYGYWLGDYAQSSGKTLPCSGELCQYEDRHCPPNSRKCPDFYGFCQLNATNNLCWEGRGGVMCSRCAKNYSFTFGAVKCAPSSTCSDLKTALIILGVVLYWVVVIILMLAILSLDLSIGLGFLYGIVYYFSTLTISTNVTITSSALLTIIYTCIAITQLIPRGFGNTNLCFVENMDLNVHHQFFNYATPMFVIAVIVVIVLKTRYCRCPKAISLAENSPIHAICVLVLFSYTSLTYTSFQILHPIRINQTTKVYIDPEIDYFSPKHLPFAIVALILECFVSLPLCFFILFAPLLSRRVNMVRLKLKPFLDDFQACYRPGCHWFAGFYFLARQVVFIVNVIPLGWMPYENHIFHFVNMAIFLIHTMVQPYKVKWLNLLDTLLLFDVLLVSMLQTTNIIPDILSYILIFPPAFYLVAIILLLTGRRVMLLVKLFRKRGHSSTELPTSPPSATTTTTVGLEDDHPFPSEEDKKDFSGSNFFKDSGEREPFLSDTDSSEHLSSVWSSGAGVERGQRFTTSSLRVSALDRFPPIGNKARTN